MALEKTGYINAQRGTTRQKVFTNEDGNIAMEGDTHKGYKYINVNQVNAGNNLADNAAVIDVFLGFVGASTDSLSNTMTVKWSVA